MDKRIKVLSKRYLEIIPSRDERLFTDFLVKGYNQTTFDFVDRQCLEEIIYGKFCLGMLITLYDDLADNPLYSNPELLVHLYQLNLGTRVSSPGLSMQDSRIYNFAANLFLILESTLRDFDRYVVVKEILKFDIRQIMLSNQYSELMGRYPFIRNLSESRSLGPYNMGMVAAGMIDVIGSHKFPLCELGSLREGLVVGQRLGRIANILSTFHREISEDDKTNEILLSPYGPDIYRNFLLKEFNEGLRELSKMGHMKNYALAMDELYHLHMAMEGVI